MLDPNKVQAIQQILKPVTKKQKMSNYAVLELPLSSLIHDQGLQALDCVTWTTDA